MNCFVFLEHAVYGVLQIMTQKECETSDNLLLSNVTNNNVEPTAE